MNPGDEVLYHEPCYVSYSPSVVLARGVARAIPTKAADHFVLRAEALERAITPRSKVLMLNFPTNPTGATMPAEELEKIAAVCVKHDLIVLSDEIYSELTYDSAAHPSLAALPGMKERTILLHGVSKAYAMTGWRIGFACAPQPVIEAMMKIHQYAILCAPIMGQEAAIEALERGEESMLKMRREYELRRNYIVRGFNELGLECFKPRGAFYVFPKISSTGLTSREFSLQLLREKKVAVVPGSAFGASGEGHVRCSYATALEQIKIAIERIGEFCSGLAPIRPPPRHLRVVYSDCLSDYVAAQCIPREQCSSAILAIHRFDWMLVEDVGLDAAEFGGVIELDSHIVEDRTYRRLLGDKDGFGLAENLEASGGIGFLRGVRN